MAEDCLVRDALLNPAEVNYISVQVINSSQLEYIALEAISDDWKVGFVLSIHDDSSILYDEFAHDLSVILVSLVLEGIEVYSESLSLEQVQFNLVLQALLLFVKSACAHSIIALHHLRLEISLFQFLLGDEAFFQPVNCYEVHLSGVSR